MRHRVTLNDCYRLFFLSILLSDANKHPISSCNIHVCLKFSCKIPYQGKQTSMKLEWLEWFHEEITEMTDTDRKEKNTKVNTPDWPGDVKLIFSIQRSKEKWSIWKECVRVSLYHFNHGCSIPQRLTVWRVICSSSLIKVYRKVILMKTKFQWLNFGLRILNNTRKYILDYSCFPWKHILC